MPKEKSQKINGIEYVYYDKPVWNAEKKYGTHKREYIGKRVDGQFIPNKSRQLQQELEQERKKKEALFLPFLAVGYSMVPPICLIPSVKSSALQKT